MMRRLIWRGAAVALMTGGICWTVAQFKQCPRCPVARLLRSVLGCTRSADSSVACSSQRAPVIVDLSAPWLKDPSALFPEDNLQLEDVIPSRERSKQLDLIDLSLLSEAANPARPNYEEELVNAVLVEVNLATASGPEAPCVNPVEANRQAPHQVTPDTVNEGNRQRYMPYAQDAPAAGPGRVVMTGASEELQIHVTEAGFRSSTEVIHVEEPPLAQEDPAAPYDYPGCLQMNPCPTIEKKASPASPKVNQAPSTPSPDRGADARPTGLKYHVTLKKSVPAQDDTSPTHPEVDTMEFRPTDAGSVDFLHRRQIY